MNFLTPASVRSSSGPSVVVSASTVSAVLLIRLSVPSARALARPSDEYSCKPSASPLTVRLSVGPNRSTSDRTPQGVALGLHALDGFHARSAVKIALGGFDGDSQRRHPSDLLESVRPLGPGLCG